MNVVVKVCERTLVKMAPLDGLCLILVSCNILRMTFSDIPFLLDWGRVRMGKRTPTVEFGPSVPACGRFS